MTQNQTRRLFAALGLGGLILGCGQTASRPPGPGGNKDLVFVFPEQDLSGGGGGDDGGGGGQMNGCGDFDPSCQGISFGPGLGKPFPLQTDKPADPNASAEGLGRDGNGYLSLDQTKAAFDFLWAANSGDISGKGTVSKFNSKTIRETARYFTVTCFSGKNGSKDPCDGSKGCCAADSNPQWQNRKNKMPSGPAQQVNLMSNAPSRTAVDFNGDMWVSNRCFGCQSSVTKIANDVSQCLDRNKNGKIDTSSDVNGDGVIQWDCNSDGMADDLDGVKAKACTNNMKQEFFGLDDECVLFTTNTGVMNNLGRPLTLGPGAQDFGPSDAWPGLYQTGQFFRVDGTTGITKDEMQLPNQSCRPYGAVVDSTSILWAGNLSGSPQAVLCWGNTKKSTEVGTTRSPGVGQVQGYGIALDRDQNIWNACLSFGACRYTPDRKNGLMNIGQGSWTMFSKPGSNSGGGYGIGMAVDNRGANAYFAWLAGNQHIAQIPASKEMPPAPGMDRLVDGAAYPTAKIAGDGKGVGVDKDQNVWNVSGSGTSGITRVKVDLNGMITQPDINSPPMGNNLCPAGDRCPHKGNNPGDPSPYTYSDFTGFGLRNFTRPKGTWTYLVKGCESGGKPFDTRWMVVRWDADVPLNTSVSVRARTGNTPTPDQTWNPWSPSFTTSPADLFNGMALPGNDMDDGFLQVEVSLATTAKDKTPKVKEVHVNWKCINIPG